MKTVFQTIFTPVLRAIGFLWAAMHAIIFGSGRVGIDYFLTKKTRLNGLSFTEKVATLFAIMLFSTFAFAQSRPLTGSGKIVTKTFDLMDFDKVNLMDLDGKTTIEVGQKFGIKINIDDNLLEFLEVSNTNGMLTVALSDNKNNRRYVENTGLKVYITMPAIEVLTARGNSGVAVSGIAGHYFRMEKLGNGSATLSGSVDKLDLKSKGNGSLYAQNLAAKFVSAELAGNGSIKVNAAVSLTATGRGNGSIIQTGKGKIEPLSGIIGNGEVRKQ